MTQTKAIHKMLLKGTWLTIPDIKWKLCAKDVFAMETTISARIRQLRGMGYEVERRTKKGTKLREYRVVV